MHQRSHKDDAASTVADPWMWSVKALEANLDLVYQYSQHYQISDAEQWVLAMTRYHLQRYYRPRDAVYHVIRNFGYHNQRIIHPLYWGPRQMTSFIDTHAEEPNEPLRAVLRANRASYVTQLAKRVLPPRQWRVVALHYGFAGGQPHSYAEIGRVLGVSKQRVAQLNTQAMHRLRQRSIINRLEVYRGN